MAKKLNEAEAAMREKMKVLMKLQDSGIQTEKDLQGMKTETMLAIKDVKIPEMRIIIETQKSVRDGRFFSYLMEAPESLVPECVIRAVHEDPAEEGDPFA